MPREDQAVRMKNNSYFYLHECLNCWVIIIEHIIKRYSMICIISKAVMIDIDLLYSLSSSIITLSVGSMICLADSQIDSESPSQKSSALSLNKLEVCEGLQRRRKRRNQNSKFVLNTWMIFNFSEKFLSLNVCHVTFIICSLTKILPWAQFLTMYLLSIP